MAVMADTSVTFAAVDLSDLNRLAALMNVARLQLDHGDRANNVPPPPPAYEDDTSLRTRLVLRPEGFSVAGPEGAYIYHARSADGDVLDASATSQHLGRCWSPSFASGRRHHLARAAGQDLGARLS